MKKICGFALVLAVVLTGRATAETTALATLFPLRAEVSAAASGFCRVELPPEVLAACRADLADLRVLDDAGREIPYLVDSPAPDGTSIEVQYRAPLEIVDAKRSQRTVDDRTTTFRESFEVLLPPRPTDVQAWELVLTTATPEFVSRIDVLSNEGGGMIRSIISGSAFRLPEAGAEKLRFALDAPDAVRLEIELRSQNTGFLQPRFTIEGSRILPTEASSEVALAIREVRTLVDMTEVVVDRPRGLVPRRLAVTTTTDTFRRRITVWDEGPGADPKALGVGTVLRVATFAPVALLEMPIRAPRGDRLRLVIEDRDSPPLDDIGVAALMPRPVLVFSLPNGKREATLYFGGGRARRPLYDLAALDPDGRLPVSGDDALLVLAMTDPAQAQPATLGPVERNPAYDDAPALAFAMHPGAAVDPRWFSHRRRVEVVPSAEGLSRIPLEPSDLAVLRPDLADLRLVDDDGRQWAYLRQHEARAVFSNLPIVEHRAADRASRYEIQIPTGALAIDRIEIQTEAPFFDRDFTLRGRLDDGSERRIAQGRLVRRADDPRPTVVSVEPLRVIGLELEIEDGNDAPLDISRIEARSMASDLYAAVAAGTYSLLLGDPEAEAPVYELERVRRKILAVPAGEAVMGELEANPDFSAASRISRAGGLHHVLLWSALGLAVIVLIGLTLRAARQEAE
jgi:hypothetical protein